MQFEDGLWKCAYCGDAVDLPLDAIPAVVITAASDKPTFRIFFYRGEEVHRCKIADDEPSRVFWRPR